MTAISILAFGICTAFFSAGLGYCRGYRAARLEARNEAMARRLADWSRG